MKEGKRGVAQTATSELGTKQEPVRLSSLLDLLEFSVCPFKLVRAREKAVSRLRIGILTSRSFGAARDYFLLLFFFLKVVVGCGGG